MTKKEFKKKTVPEKAQKKTKKTATTKVLKVPQKLQKEERKEEVAQEITLREEQKEFKEKVIQINRVARVVKGGRRFRFRAIVVVGDDKGKVGIGVGKGTEIPIAVEKAKNKALKNIISVSLCGTTIPHEVQASFGSAKILLKPASPGTGVIAGGAVRAVVELAGIKDVLSKILGSSNKINNVKACFLGLKSLKSPKATDK
jgi:small subunit ribosomal protein S5